MTTSGREIYSVRADSYRTGRPAYPPRITEVLKRHDVIPGAIVVDLGAGAGAMSRPLVDSGFRVIAVEPNTAMRRLGLPVGACAVAAVAETLPFSDDSIDAVVVGQALHWFDPDPSATSIWRVLRPGRGVLVAAWNERRIESPFERDVEATLLRAAPAYVQTATHESARTVFERFTCGRAYNVDTYANQQDLDEDQLQARFLSTSWAPEPGSPQAALLCMELLAAFHRHCHHGRVRLNYHTLVLSTTPN